MKLGLGTHVAAVSATNVREFFIVSADCHLLLRDLGADGVD